MRLLDRKCQHHLCDMLPGTANFREVQCGKEDVGEGSKKGERRIKRGHRSHRENVHDAYNYLCYKAIKRHIESNTALRSTKSLYASLGIVT